MKTVINTLFLLLFFTTTEAQNLVINPSFEEMEYCPSDFTQQNLKSLTKWTQAGDGTPDHFNSCSKKVGVPNNMFGQQMARTGNGYAGLGTYLNNHNRYREYLLGSLSRPLNPGEQVCITLYYSAADNCQFVHDGFGVLLSAQPPKAIASKPLLLKEVSLSNPKFIMMDDAEQWVELSGYFVAKGGEQFITIGNFKDDKELRIIRRTQDSKVPENREYSYLFLDDISVVSIDNKNSCSCVNEKLQEVAVDPPLELQEYEEVVLDAVHFNFDEFTLTDSAVNQLENIYVMMRKNKYMYMEIHGHTDAKGAMAYNQVLSENRAHSVIDFIVMKGIDQKRFEIKALGSSQPVASNETEEGRALNRRVEFRIRRKKYELVN